MVNKKKSQVECEQNRRGNKSIRGRVTPTKGNRK